MATLYLAHQMKIVHVWRRKEKAMTNILTQVKYTRHKKQC